MRERFRHLPISEAIGIVVGGALGFLTPPVADWFVAQSSWPDYFKFMVHRMVQSTEVRIALAVLGGGAGLFVGNFLGHEKQRIQAERAFLSEERGSARVAAAVAVGLLALGTGVVAPLIVDAAERILPEIGKVIVGAPAINGGRFY